MSWGDAQEGSSPASVSTWLARLYLLPLQLAGSFSRHAKLSERWVYY